MLESTYFGENHVPRAETEARFIESVLETLDRGGTALIPALQLTRLKRSLCCLMLTESRPMWTEWAWIYKKILRKYPEYLKNPRLLDRAFERAITVDQQRDSVLKEPAVIVTNQEC